MNNVDLIHQLFPAIQKLLTESHLLIVITNSKVNTIKLHSVKVRYIDGTTSTKAAVFSNGYSGDETLLSDGPLKPY